MSLLAFYLLPSVYSHSENRTFKPLYFPQHLSLFTLSKKSSVRFTPTGRNRLNHSVKCVARGGGGIRKTENRTTPLEYLFSP